MCVGVLLVRHRVLLLERHLVLRALVACHCHVALGIGVVGYGCACPHAICYGQLSSEWHSSHSRPIWHTILEEGRLK